MQGPSDVWRGDHHDKFFFWFLSHGSLRVTRIEPRCFPPLLPSGFNGIGMISCGHGNFGEILLFSFGCLIDKSRSCGSFFLGLFVLLSFSPLRLFLFLSLVFISFHNRQHCEKWILYYKSTTVDLALAIQSMIKHTPCPWQASLADSLIVSSRLRRVADQPPLLLLLPLPWLLCFSSVRDGSLCGREGNVVTAGRMVS